jgi:hypothetical protein
MTARQTRAIVAPLLTVLVVLFVISWHAWPSPSDHRLSSAATERACGVIAERHGGFVGASVGLSVADSIKLNRNFQFGASTFLASVPRSKGLAVCEVLGSNDLPVCSDGGNPARLSTILVTPDGSRYTKWCPAP